MKAIYGKMIGATPTKYYYGETMPRNSFPTNVGYSKDRIFILVKMRVLITCPSGSLVGVAT